MRRSTTSSRHSGTTAASAPPRRPAGAGTELVDTGANITVLTPADAERVGIPKVDTGKRIDVTGINRSVVTSYRSVGTWNIALGPIALSNVPIAVDDSDQLPNSILGQDAFCNVDQITIRFDTIEFKHAGPVAQGCPGPNG